MSIGAMLFNKFHFNIKAMVGIAVAFQIIGMLVCTLSETYYSSVILFTFLFSVGSGMVNILCLQTLWEHFYNNRGEITGFVYFTFYVGQYLFVNLSNAMINPEDE